MEAELKEKSDHEEKFNQDIGSWNVRRVTNMEEVFYLAGDFNQDISGWNVSNVTTMKSMFSSAFNFNQDIGSWDVSKVTDMSEMFRGYIFKVNLSKWNVISIHIY